MYGLSIQFHTNLLLIEDPYSSQVLQCVQKDVFDTARKYNKQFQSLLHECRLNKVLKLTMSGSRWCSINAENSTKRSLCVAIALPSHGGLLGG